MKLNCKPMEIAVVIKSGCGNEGKIVRCLRLATADEVRKALFSERKGPVWKIDQALMSVRGFYVELAHDSFLRPIRPGEGDDETLTWAGKPEKVTA